MIKNYLKIAVRNLFRKKFYSLINILGLSIGIATTLLILLYISDEFSYDRFHHNPENIHRAYMKGRLHDQEFFGYTSCNPLGPVGKEEIPEIEDFCRLNMWREVILKYEDLSFAEEKLLLADSSFFDFFNFKLIQGDPKTALKEPNSIILTEALAKKYFNYSGPGDITPMGKMINIGTGEWLHKVTGIIEETPQNTHIKFDLIMSINSWDYMERNQWTSNNLTTYMKLVPGADIEVVEEKIRQMVNTYVGPELQQFLGISLEVFEEQGGSYGYFLTPMLDLRLRPEAPEYFFEPPGNINYIYILSAIAIFIIVIACINFMNLSTARSAERAKEVGIRKTIGARRYVLIVQFLSESIIFTLISMIIALGVTYLLLPAFNQVAGKALMFITIFQPTQIMAMIFLILFVGLLAGSYPAFYLTSFSPSSVLHGKVRAGMKSSGIRSGLVIFQFTISIILIICTLLVFQQLNHLQNINMGLDKENVLILQNARSLQDGKESFAQELTAFEEVESATISNSHPPHIGSNSVYRPIGQGKEDILLDYATVDENFLETYGLTMVEGRFFSKDFPSDTIAIVLNERAAEMINWENPIGERIGTFNGPDEDLYELEVVGIVQDFNYQSLKSEIKPMAFLYGKWGGIISIKLNTENIRETIAMIEDKWKGAVEGAPFEFDFLDETFNELYFAEQRLGKIFMIFAILAIFVACLGLFGLATFTAEQRSKEIGIRKAMGANVSSVMLLLSKDYIKLVIISFVLSSPISYYIMIKWLENFAYRIDIGVVTFAVSGFAALIIAWLTVSYQSFKAASMNPVNSLRYE